MTDCEFIHASPDRPNIYYAVKPRIDIEMDMQPLVDLLKKERLNTPRTIV